MRTFLSDIADGLGVLLFICVCAAGFCAAVVLAVKFAAFAVTLGMAAVLFGCWAIGWARRKDREEAQRSV